MEKPKRKVNIKVCYFPTPRPINTHQNQNSILLIILPKFVYSVCFTSWIVHFISFSPTIVPIITISFLRSISPLNRNLETKGHMQTSFLKWIHNVLNIDFKQNKITNECHFFKVFSIVHLKRFLISNLFSWNSVKQIKDLSLADWV